MITPDTVLEILTGNNVTYTTNDIAHGRQFRFPCGAILSVYTTGKTVWGGKTTEMKDRIDRLIGTDTVANTNALSSVGNANIANNKIFIVYGHDTDVREQLELLLRRFKLEPIVLQNLPAAGETIIEKLENNSNQVTYACVLLTPDDEGYKSGEQDSKKFRARQNVVLELGMFLARLGRKRVAILHKGEIELPSDISGLVYIPFKEKIEEVRDKIAAELQEAGFQINIKDLLC